jgi:hypothetical protein
MSQGNFTFYTVLFVAILFAGIGVLLYNRRLSRWMWVWIAGYAGPLLLMTLQVLLSPWYSNITYAAIQTSLYLGADAK